MACSCRRNLWLRPTTFGICCDYVRGQSVDGGQYIEFAGLYTIPATESTRDTIFRTLLRLAAVAQEIGFLQDTSEIYIVLSSQAAGVQLPASEIAKYPDQITLVLQYEFKDLLVRQEDLEVTLWFGGHASLVRVPYRAINLFLDGNFGVCYRSGG